MRVAILFLLSLFSFKVLASTESDRSVGLLEKKGSAPKATSFELALDRDHAITKVLSMAIPYLNTFASYIVSGTVDEYFLDEEEKKYVKSLASLFDIRLPDETRSLILGKLYEERTEAVNIFDVKIGLDRFIILFDAYLQLGESKGNRFEEEYSPGTYYIHLRAKDLSEGQDVGSILSLHYKTLTPLYTIVVQDIEDDAVGDLLPNYYTVLGKTYYRMPEFTVFKDSFIVALYQRERDKAIDFWPGSTESVIYVETLAASNVPVIREKAKKYLSTQDNPVNVDWPVWPRNFFRYILAILLAKPDMPFALRRLWIERLLSQGDKLWVFPKVTYRKDLLEPLLDADEKGFMSRVYPLSYKISSLKKLNNKAVQNLLARMPKDYFGSKYLLVCDAEGAVTTWPHTFQEVIQKKDDEQKSKIKAFLNREKAVLGDEKYELYLDIVIKKSNYALYEMQE